MAIPMKRQMINVEQLRFPSGIAAAETLRALHAAGGTGARSARALAWAGLIALAGKFWAEGLTLVSAKLAPAMIGTWVAALNQRVFGPAWMGRTVVLSWEPMFIAAGAITGLRVCWSMLLGSVTAWMIFVPALQHRGVIEGAGYGALVQWTLWPGVACMVTSSLFSFALRVAHRAARVRRPRRDVRRRPPGRSRSAGGHRAAGLVVHRGPAHRLRRTGVARPPHVRDALLADGGGRAALVRALAGRLPGDRRDRHHAGGRDGQDHPAHLRRAAARGT